jgi:hypothetical protein
MKEKVVKEAVGVVARVHAFRRVVGSPQRQNTISIHVSADMTYREITCIGPGFST